MRRIKQVFLSYILVLAASTATYSRAGEIVAPKPADVPDWALASLTLRELGNDFEKFSSFSDKLMANSGELARQIALNFMFTLPVEDGVKKDAPALIYALDPQATATKEERAYMLSLSDAAAMKAALIAAFGAPVEENGIMTFTLLQPPPQADKFMLVKIVNNRLFAAPTALTLKKLEEHLEGKTDEALKAGTSAGAALSIKMANVKRTFGPQIALGLGILSQLAGPERADEFTAVSQLIDTVWQLDVLDVRMDFDATGDNVDIELAAVPRTGTDLATRLAAAGKAVPEDALRVMPDNAATFAAWNVSGAQLAETLRGRMGEWMKGNDVSPALKQADTEFAKAVTDFVELIDGETALSLSDGKETLIGLVAVRSPEPAKAGARLKTVFEKLISGGNALSKVDAGGMKFSIIGQPEQNHSGSKIETFQITVEPAPKELQSLLKQTFGWPLSVQVTQTKDRMVAAFGKDGLKTLQDFLDREKENAGLPLRAKAVYAAAAKEPQFLFNFDPIYLAKLLVAHVPHTPEISLEKLLRAIKESQVTMSAKSDKMVYFRLHLPAAACDAIGTMSQRVQRANVKLKDLNGGAPESVPPPPPAP